MSRVHLMLAHCFSVSCAVLFLTLLVPLCAAQFKAADNFNRADGSVGLGWSTWGNGAQISGNQLETFGATNVAGGIQRKLDVTFPLKFSFNFSTNSPPDGAWLIAFNSATAVDNFNAVEFGITQNSGSRPICFGFQNSGGPSFQCVGLVSGQRDYTATALISGVVNADFSAKITVKYNDGMSPATVTVKIPSPAGALALPQGSVFYFGNNSASNGPHFFDNFQLSLM